MIMQKGVVRKRSSKQLSEYGRQLHEKQELKGQYNMRERQFQNYVKAVLEASSKGHGSSPELLVQKLERRLDNVVFRMGLAQTRAQARQMVSHGHCMVNEHPVDIPSYQVKKDDVIVVRPSSKESPLFKNAQLGLKNYEAPSWIALDKEKLEAKIMGVPNFQETAPTVQFALIFEFYSR